MCSNVDMRAAILRLVFLVFIVPGVGAQEGGPVGWSKDINKKLTNASTETLQCSASDIEAAGRKAVRRDASCDVDVDRALALAKNASSVLVDIRGKEDYARLHMSGAINLPMSEIKTKTYLTNRTLLIYGTGRADPLLDELCSDLKGRGFRNARIISGGAMALAKANAGLAISADVDMRSLGTLSALDLFAEVNSNDNMIISVSPSFSNKDVEAKQIRLDAPLTPENLISVVRKGLGRQARDSIKRLVLVGVNGVDPAVLSAVVSSPKIDWPVFFYAADSASYAGSIKGLNALWTKKAKGPVAQKCGIT